jgi:HSP20 family protein
MSLSNRDRTTDLATSAPEDIWSHMDRLFRNFERDILGAFRGPAPTGTAGMPVPALPALADVADKGDAYEISADLPGIPKEKIDVRVAGNLVQIRAENDLQKEEKDKNFLRRERYYSGFQRLIELPEQVEGEGVKARYENGVLTITVPKANPVQEKKVSVE